MALKLGYWRAGGLAEPIRMLLHVLGQEYENVEFILPEDWLPVKQKRTEDGDLFMNLPYLEDGDLLITESGAITYYLCQKFNKDLYGKNTLDTTRVHQINGVLNDLDLAVLDLAFKEGPKEAIGKSIAEGGKGHEMINKLSAYIGDGEKEFLLGYLTFVDLKLANFIFLCRNIILSFGLEDPFAKHPNLLKFTKRIYEHDILKGYIGSKNYYPGLDIEVTPWFKEHPLP